MAVAKTPEAPPLPLPKAGCGNCLDPKSLYGATWYGAACCSSSPPVSGSLLKVAVAEIPAEAPPLPLPTVGLGNCLDTE